MALTSTLLGQPATGAAWDLTDCAGLQLVALTSGVYFADSAVWQAAAASAKPMPR